MIIQRRVTWLFACLQMLLLSACGVASHAQASSVNDEQRLYEIKEPMDLQGLSTLTSSDADVNFLKALKQSRNIEDARFIDIKPALVKAGTGRLSLPLPNGDTVKFKQRIAHEESGDAAYWFGDIISDQKHRYSSPSKADVDPVSRIMLVRQGQRLSGEIHLPGQFYRLENAGAGRHVLIKLDPQSNLGCDPVDDNKSHGKDLKKAVSGSQPKARSTIRVMFVSTKEARELDGNPGFRLLTMLASASQTFRNSNVDLDFEYAGLFQLSFKESEFDNDPAKILYEISEEKTDPNKPIAALRETNRADIVIALVHYPFFEGKAYIGARKQNAFALINMRHESVNLTHQLGHLLGGAKTHTWKGGPEPGDPTYRFGHQFKANGVEYRTLMGKYDCNSGSCPWEFDSFSDPSATFDSVPLGDGKYSNTVRLFNEVRDEVSKFYP